jgi:hypothetical protein
MIERNGWEHSSNHQRRGRCTRYRRRLRPAKIIAGSGAPPPEEKYN